MKEKTKTYIKFSVGLLMFCVGMGWIILIYPKIYVPLALAFCGVAFAISSDMERMLIQ